MQLPEHRHGRPLEVGNQSTQRHCNHGDSAHRQPSSLATWQRMWPAFKESQQELHPGDPSLTVAQWPDRQACPEVDMRLPVLSKALRLTKSLGRRVTN
eukprot:11140243-Alexandrium_andersonii.AAC.1